MFKSFHNSVKYCMYVKIIRMIIYALFCNKKFALNEMKTTKKLLVEMTVDKY